MLTPMLRIALVSLTALLCLEPRSPAQDGVKAVRLGGLPGPYGLAQWQADWPGCRFQGGITEGRVTLEETDGQRALRVHYAPGQIGPEAGGAGWRWPLGTHEAAELTYTLRFSEGFDFVKGGKLPGLCGGPDNVSGGRPADGRNGFSARLMWRKDGRGEAYVYHKHQPDRYGDRFAFPADFRFPTGQPVRVRIAVAMNTPGQRDGQLRVWIALPGANERQMVERTDLQWRDRADFGVDSLYFETFHGGSDATWAPTRPCWAEFGAMAVRAR